MPCLNTYGGFQCNCTDTHFAGALCELIVCNGTVCHNNGTCSPGADRVPRCLCLEGFTGVSCQTNVDDCAGSPCKNGATCQDLVAHFACDCPLGFAGPLCEQNVDDCASSPCQNGATCWDKVANFTCDCPLGFTGRLCEQNVDDCASSPCQNGATCRDQVANFTCDCLLGFNGSLCQQNVDDCAGSPCQNSGSCTDGVANFSCACPPGYSGRACERPTVAAPNVTADRLIGNAPAEMASGGSSVGVAGAAAGSTVGFMVLAGVGILVGVFLLRNRHASSNISDDASSGAFSNAVYNNAGEYSGNGTTLCRPAPADNEEVYEYIGNAEATASSPSSWTPSGGANPAYQIEV